jgi:probable HAF family extracellular repeat protein
MKALKLKWTSAVAMTLFVSLVLPVAVAAQAIPVQMTAQNQHEVSSQHHHYQLVQFPTLGGSQTNFFDSANNVGVLNNRGAVSGGGSVTLLPDPYSPTYWWEPSGTVYHGFIWQNGSLTDLGSLPGNNNSGATWISANGTVAGYSENGQIDPSVPDLPEFSAVMWRNSKITDLGTLPGGGYESSAVSVNSRGQVAGVATNLVPDANSLAPYLSDLWLYVPYGYQTRAFVWNRKSGMQDLGTLGTGTNAQAIAINERGQVIGDSYTSSAPGACNAWGQGPLTTGAFIWDRAHGMVDLGGFGGTCTMAQGLNNAGQVIGQSNVAGDGYARAFLWQNGSLHDLGGSLGGNGTSAIVINEPGDVAGFASLPGETTIHATLWRRTGQMTDLGTVGTDPCSIAHGLNDKGQVVGDSTPSTCANFDTSRPFLWENGSMADLNTLIPPNSPLHLVWAYSINQKGEIAVNGFDANNVEQAALLIPCDEDHPGVERCDYNLMDAVPAVAESAVRHYGPSTSQRLPQARRSNRYHLPGLQPAIR